jgi:CHAD domain-containing protein
MAKAWEELTERVELKLAVRFVLASRLDRLHAQVERLTRDRSNVPVEPVHQVRVYCRRVQSAIDVLGDQIPEKHSQKMAKVVQRLRRAAGRVRDWDVLAGELSNIRDQAPSNQTPAIDWLLDQYRPQRASGVERLAGRVRKIDRRGFWEWVRKHYSPDRPGERLREAKDGETSLGDWAAVKMLPEIEIFERASASYRGGAIEQLHLLRLAVKRFRYLLEIFAGCLGPNFRSAIQQPISRWQELLGCLNDSHEFALRFDQWARESNDRELARSFIALRDRYAALSEEAAGQFHEQWSLAEQEQVLGEIRCRVGIAVPRSEG